jgi:hypothetical protein
MNAWKRVLWGGGGAVMPIVLSLAVVDAAKVAEYAESGPNALVGYVLRVVALFAIGALWAYFHRTETEPFKAFQLGLVAPAMITAFINSQNVDELRGPGKEGHVYGFSIVPKAYAQTGPVQPTPTDSVIKGVRGR